MKRYWWMEVQLHTLLTSALDGDEWPALWSSIRAPGTHWTGCWMDLLASLDVVMKRKIPIIVTWTYLKEFYLFTQNCRVGELKFASYQTEGGTVSWKSFFLPYQCYNMLSSANDDHLIFRNKNHSIFQTLAQTLLWLI